MSSKYKLFEEDDSLTNGAIAHAFFPQNRQIHINDKLFIITRYL
jgi:hypothetical protein